MGKGRDTVKEQKDTLYGRITDIQEYTIHDGPGIRTEIFFKGCTMHCLWCSNPETISPSPQLGVYTDQCIGESVCGACREACPLPESPLRFDREGRLAPVKMAPACTECLRCARECPSEALMVWGELWTVPQLLQRVLRNRSFYDRSGGGVTLNGGEVLVQWEFAKAFIAACKRENINVCVETALNCPSEHVFQTLEQADYIITDIKHMDPEIHRRLTGRTNELVLHNIKELVRRGKRLVIRTPVVPGYNDDEANIRATAAFIRDELDNRILQYQLLPYRKLGTEKGAALGIPYGMGDYKPVEREVWEKNLLRLVDLVSNEYGIAAAAGSGKKWS